MSDRLAILTAVVSLVLMLAGVYLYARHGRP